MKKLRLLFPVLIICLLLNGCGFLLPFFYFSFPSQESPAELLPVGSDVDPNLSAEDIYYRAKFAAGVRATQYTEAATIGLSEVGNGEVYPYDLHVNMQVTLSTEDCAVNARTAVAFDSEPDDVYWEYYRQENDALICYYHDETANEYIREQIDLGDLKPYAIIADYSVRGYPASPDNLWLDPKTRILNDREVYLLTYSESALYTFGSTGNPDYDSKLDQRNIAHTWYVDAETFFPAQLEFSLTQVDDLLGSILDSKYYLSLSEGGIAIRNFSLTLKDIAYTPLQVPDIPEEVLRKAWENAGFSDS